jgi:hypothetical protein
MQNIVPMFTTFYGSSVSRLEKGRKTTVGTKLPTGVKPSIIAMVDTPADTLPPTFDQSKGWLEEQTGNGDILSRKKCAGADA